jgi:predicted esterase
VRNCARALIGLLAIVKSISVCASECASFGDPPAQVDHGWFTSFVSARYPLCLGGEVLGPWTDRGGDKRYSCVYEPAYSRAADPLPLVIFLHSSVVTADSVRLTGLVGLTDKGDLGGKRSGFILLAPEGRYTSHFYPGLDSNALGWDNWYRQLSPAGDITIDGSVYPENRDAAAIDHFVQEVLATRNVDRRRIYAMGWSNGAAMALLYALNRPWIAAAAVYSAPDPFAALFDVCTQTPVKVKPVGDGQAQIFNPTVPLMHVRNSCDIGGICPNGSRFATRMRALGNSLYDVILDPSGRRVTSCDDTCGTDEMADGQLGRGASFRGLINHMRWPSDWNGRMLNFLKLH